MNVFCFFSLLLLQLSAVLFIEVCCDDAHPSLIWLCLNACLVELEVSGGRHRN